MSHVLAILLAAPLFLLLAAAPAGAVVSPSGVDWSVHRVLGLESDDISNGEYNMSCIASTRYGMNVPWTGTQWTNVANAIRGHQDALGTQVPLTLYVVSNFMEPDFTPLSSDSSQVFNEPFNPGLAGWTAYGSNPPTISGSYYVSPWTSALYDTPTPTADGWARKYVYECKEYKVTFWYRLDNVQARTHLVSVSGAYGRTMGIEAQSTTGKLYLREGFYSTDEILTPIGPYQAGVWRKISFRQVGGRVQVDMNDDGTIELDKPAAFLPTVTNQVLIGDPSTTIYSGRAYLDDLVLERYDNTYPSAPRITPVDMKFPDAVAAINANRDIFLPQSHGFTHGNDLQVQARYANGSVPDWNLPEEDWWREDYDVIDSVPWGVIYQYNRFHQAFDILQRAFGLRPVIHVSPGNVFGHDTDPALSMAGVYDHETLTTGAGNTSPDDPSVFWSDRTGDQELFYQLSDPDPVLSASLAARQVDSLLNIGYPVLMQTHAWNALVPPGDGTALATYFDRLLDTLAVKHPSLVAMSMDEVTGLERDGWSVSAQRGNHIYARNYLAAPHNFRVTVPDTLVVSTVRSLQTQLPVPWQTVGNDVVFSGSPGDYELTLMPASWASVDGATRGAPGAVAARIQAWPNPARGAVTLNVDLPGGASRARLIIVDARGRLVREIQEGELAAGRSAILWDGMDARGEPAAPGTYFARLETAGKTTQTKLLVVR